MHYRELNNDRTFIPYKETLQNFFLSGVSRAFLQTMKTRITYSVPNILFTQNYVCSPFVIIKKLQLYNKGYNYYYSDTLLRFHSLQLQQFNYPHTYYYQGLLH
jgi:hypothetical protein